MLELSQRLTTRTVILLTQAGVCQEECACYPDEGTVISARHMSNSQQRDLGGRQVLGNTQNILGKQEKGTDLDI